MQCYYKIKSLEDIYKLNKLASREDFNIYISVNSTMLDAKSLLALFTLLGKEINLVAPDHIDSAKFIKFVSRLK